MGKNLVKLAVDIVLGIIFALLFNHHVLGGLTFHEIAGLAIGGGVVAHVLLNAKWVRKVTCALFSPKTNAKTRFGYLLNVALLVDLVVIIVSGIFISKVLLPDLAELNIWPNMQQIHIATSYIGLGLIGIHVGLHRQWLMAMCRKIFNIGARSSVRGALAHIVMVAVLACGIFSMVNVGYWEKAVTFTQDENAAAGHGHGGSRAQHSGEAQSENTAGADGAVSDEAGAGKNYHTDGGEPELGSNDDTQSDEAQSEDARAARAAYAATVNPFEVAATYLSIMAAFAVATGYIEIGINKFNRRKRGSAPADSATY